MTAMTVFENSLVLLGAGASVEAGVPGSFEMTRRLVKLIEGEDPLRFGPALNFVCGSLLAYDSAQGLSPFDSLDVERVFSAVELLAERRTLEVTPFVAAWDAAVDSLDRPEAGITGPTDTRFRKSILEERGPSTTQLVNQLIDKRIAGDPDSTVYAGLAERMILGLRKLVATTPKSVQYLGPLVEAARQREGLTIATLNYDLSVEHAAEGAGVKVSTGIEDLEMGGLVGWPPDGIRLLKLHGSIDWGWQDARMRDGYLPFEYVGRVEPPEDRISRPALIFGRRGKLRAEGPFLGLLTEFEDQLHRSVRLIAVGYSFRDDHVNEILRRWIAEDADRHLIIVDPSWPDGMDWNGDFREQMNRYLVPGSWLAEPDFEQRLTVRRQPCSEFLQDPESPM
jgi:hypothetical protein